MSVCGGIDLGSVYNCDSPPQAGIEKRLILFNRADIATVTYDMTDPNIITDITLNMGEQGYAFEGFKNSIQPQVSLIVQPVSIGYDHQFTFNVWEISQAQKNNLEKMAVGSICGIMENVKQDADAFEVFGLNAGMEISELTRIATSTETAGSYTVVLKSNEETGIESKLPQTWYDGTSYASTAALVEAILSPAGP